MNGSFVLFISPTKVDFFFGTLALTGTLLNISDLSLEVSSIN